MTGWRLEEPTAPPGLSRSDAIEIALSQTWTGRDIRGLPVDAEYGVLAHRGTIFDRADVWKITVDVSSRQWDMEYEGPDGKMVDGQMYSAQYVRVPKVGTVVFIVDDKAGCILFASVLPQPGGERRIEWHRTGPSGGDP